MAAKKTVNNNLTFVVTKEKEPEQQTVPVLLPEILGSDGDMKVDQYEHLTYGNEDFEKQYHIKRGVPMDIPVDVFIKLKEGRYPNL